MVGRSTRCPVIVMLTGTALFLPVPTPVLCIAQVRDAAVHQGIYLLHATLLAVIVEAVSYTHLYLWFQSYEWSCNRDYQKRKSRSS